MSRHIKILEYALSSMLRRKYKNLSLILVFSFLIAVLSSILFFTYSFKIEALNMLSGSPSIVVQRIMAGRHDLIPLSYIGPITHIPGVGTVAPRYWGYYYDPSTGSNYTIQGVSKDMNGLFDVIDGTWLDPNSRDTCVIGHGVAQERFLGINGTLPIYGTDGDLRSFRVTGIFRSSSEILTNDLVLLSNNTIQDLFGIPSQKATDLTVQVYNPVEISNIARKIKKMFPDTRPITRDEIIRTYSTLFSWRSGLILTMFAGALVAFCILAWDKATGLSAEERKEIGILKAIGWETSDVLILKFWEGAVISLISFLTGSIAAFVHIFFFNASILAPVLKGWSVLFPEFHPVSHISFYHVFIIMSLTIIPYIASTVIPSWKTAITDPDSVMRG